MQIKIEIDQECQELEVRIRASEMNDEVHGLVQRLSSTQQKHLAGFTEDGVVPLDAADIIRVYTAGKKVFAQTNAGQFHLRLRLYELEGRLEKAQFVRISNAEIVNMKAIKKMDLSLAGTISLLLSNGETTYASRRYVAKIKQRLGM